MPWEIFLFLDLFGGLYSDMDSFLLRVDLLVSWFAHLSSVNVVVEVVLVWIVTSVEVFAEELAVEWVVHTVAVFDWEFLNISILVDSLAVSLSQHS